MNAYVQILHTVLEHHQGIAHGYNPAHVKHF